MHLLLAMMVSLLATVTHASEFISYSGRLVNSNGSPVSGNVNLTFDLAYSGQLGVNICSRNLDGVGLVNGVFHVTLNFSNCNLINVLAAIPSGQSISIRVTDRTPDPDRVYSFQAIHSIPFSLMSEISKQLAQMSAIEGQVLTWDDTAKLWVPRTPVAPSGGTVTSVMGDQGLSSSTTSGNVTVGILDEGVTSVKIKDDTIVDADISTIAGIAQSKILNLTTDLAAKESLIGTGASTDYLDGTKAWNNFDQSVRNALLIGYTSGSATPVAATDNVMEAIGKLEGQIIANDTAFDNAGQWDKDGTLLFYNSGNVGVGTATPADKLEVVGDISVSSKLRFKNSAISYVELRAPVGAGAVTLTLPAALGTNGQVLSTDSSGNLSWLTPSTDSSQITDGSIVDADVSASANIAQSKISGLVTALSGKEPSLASGAAGQYLAGGKVWATLNTDAVPEGSTRLYFTEDKVLATDLLGLDTTAGSVTASDSILSAMGKTVGNVTALTTAQSDFLKKDGSVTMTGDLDVGGNSIINLSDPASAQDAATKAYVDLKSSKWTGSGSHIFFNTGNVGVGTSTPIAKFDVKGALALSGSTSGYVAFTSPAVAGSTLYTMPSSDGTGGYVLSTNGAGTLSWIAQPTSNAPSGAAGGDLSGTYPNPTISGLAATKISDGSISNSEFGYLNGVSSNLQTQLDAKEATITGGTIDQYWAGTKAWRDFDTDVRTALLSAYSVTSGVVSNGDGIQTAISKLDGNIASLQANGQWTKTGSTIYYNSGNVGIATTAPAELLHLNAATGVLRSGLRTSWTDTNSYGEWNAYEGATFMGGLAVFGSNFSTANWRNAMVMTAASNDLGSIIFRTKTSSTYQERMIVSNAGNVGIGTTGPSSKLQVVGGTIRSDLGSTGQSFIGTGTGSNLQISHDGGANVAIFNSGGGIDFRGTNGTTKLMSIQSDGNIGISTISPGILNGWTAAPASRVLEISGDGSESASSDGILVFTNNRTTPTTGDQMGAIVFGSKNDPGGIHSAMASYLTGTGGVNGFGSNIGFHTKPDNISGHLTRMTIDANGSVGIGTTTPTSKLEVNGQIAGKSIKTRLFTAGGKNAPSCTLSNANVINSMTQFCDLVINLTLTEAASVQINYTIAMEAGPDGSKHIVTGINIDGTMVTTNISGVNDTTSPYWGATQTHFSELAAGAHTIKVQYRTPAGGTSHPASGDWQNRILQVMILGYQ